MFHWPHTMLTAAVVLLAGSFAAGQTDAPAPPLGGPTVKERKIPGVYETFGKPGKDGKGKYGRGIPPEILQKAIGALDKDETPADARLTDAQRDAIHKLGAEFRASATAYKAEHKSEVEECRRVLASADGKTGKPPAPRPDDDGRIADARERLAELRGNAPNARDLQTRVWNVLTGPQQAIVQAEVDTWIKAREADRARESVRKRLGKNGPPTPQEADRLPPKLRERLANMTPEERKKALERLRERADRPRGRRPGTEVAKPPPPMEDVPIPAPEAEPER